MKVILTFLIEVYSHIFEIVLITLNHCFEVSKASVFRFPLSRFIQVYDTLRSFSSHLPTISGDSYFVLYPTCTSHWQSLSEEYLNVLYAPLDYECILL